MGDIVKLTCWATVRQTMPDGSVIERRCQRPPMHNQRVCPVHGGNTPNGLANGARRQVEEEVAKTLARFGVPVVADPKQILLDQLYQAYGNTEVMRGLLKDVQPEDVADDDPQTRARARGLLNLYAEWQERAAELAAMAIKAGLEERIVRLAEGQANEFVRIVREALDETLPEEQRNQVLRAVAQKMRLLVA